MDPSFLQLSRTVHQEKLQAAAKEQRFIKAAISGDKPRPIINRSAKWLVLLIILTTLIAIGF